MKWLSMLGLACLVFSVPVLQSKAGGRVRERPSQPRGIRSGAKARRPPTTIWERMADPKEWWQSRLLRANPQERNLRLGTVAGPTAKTGGAAITNPIFLIPPTFDSGGGFAAVVVPGDFNGDGKPDLLVANSCAANTDCSPGRLATVAVLPGNGDGTYQAPVVSNTGAVLSSLTVGDFNRDGKLDVAVGNGCPDIGCTSGTINVLLGNGNGTFQAPVSYPTGSNAFSAEAGDANGDGKLDLVVVTSPENAGVMLGNGDGTFQPISTFSTSLSAGTPVRTAVFLGDFNGDSMPDLAAVAETCDGNSCDSLVGVLLGNGDGTFHTASGVQTFTGMNPQAVALGDVNGDGKLDLAVVESCISEVCGFGPETVNVLLGNGGGTFGSTQTSLMGSDDVTFIHFGDLDGDGKPDMGTVDATGEAGIMLGAGDGAFRFGSSYETNGLPSGSGALGDLNGDGKIDFAVVNSCQLNFQNTCNGSVIALLGNGRGTFAGPVGYFAGGSTLAMTSADLNQDGAPDLVVGSPCANRDCSASGIAVLLGKPDGTFQLSAAYDPVGYGPRSLAAGDFNGDGKTDVVVLNSCVGQADCSHGVLTVLFGNGDGTLSAPTAYPFGLEPKSVTAGDFNGDGRLDLAVTQCASGHFCTDGSTGVVSVLLGNGDGSFGSAVDYSSGDPYALAVVAADLNGDGKLDVAVSNGNCRLSPDGEIIECLTGSVGVLAGNGDGTFQPAVRYSSLDNDSFSLTVGDVNGDGKPDLAVGNLGCSDLSLCPGAGSVAVLLNKGDGTFQTPSSTIPILELWTGFLIDTRGNALAISDLDGDGKPDLVLSNRDVLVGNGDGTFQAAQSYSPGVQAGESAVVADFNGDGKPDLAVGEFSLARVLLNISAGFGHATTTTLTSSGNPANLHQNVTFTAQVSSTSPGEPGGTVTLSDNGHALDSEALSNGKARFSTNSLEAGVHSITATYGGDSEFLPSASAPIEQVVHSQTHVHLTSSQNPSKHNRPVTFVAVVIADSGGTPDGTVTFRDFFTFLGTVQLQDGQAALTVILHRKGPHIIHAVYGGSRIFRRSSAVLAQRVK